MLPHMTEMRKTINIGEAAVVIGLSVTFLVIALLAFAFLMITLILVVLGFTGFGGTAAWIGKILIVFLLILFVISLIFGHRRATTNVSK